MPNEMKISIIIDAKGNAAIAGIKQVGESVDGMERTTGGAVAKLKEHWLGLSVAIMGTYMAVQRATQYVEQGARWPG